MAAFKVGDVVRLKSGGPKMTVVETKEDDSIRCQWFASNEPKHETFRAETLKYTTTAVYAMVIAARIHAPNEADMSG